MALYISDVDSAVLMILISKTNILDELIHFTPFWLTFFTGGLFFSTARHCAYFLNRGPCGLRVLKGHIAPYLLMWDRTLTFDVVLLTFIMLHFLWPVTIYFRWGARGVIWWSVYIIGWLPTKTRAALQLDLSLDLRLAEVYECPYQLCLVQWLFMICCMGVYDTTEWVFIISGWCSHVPW